MLEPFARILTLAAVLVLAGGSTACVEATHNAAVAADVARMRSEGLEREGQIARLIFVQGQLAAQLQGGVAHEREMLKARVAALEAENAGLSARLEHAEHQLQYGKVAAVPRRLDVVVPYDLTSLLAKPRPAGKREALAPAPRPSKSRPARMLDETVPYAFEPAVSQEEPPAAPRMLDENIPY